LTEFGDIPTNLPATIVVANGFDEITSPVTTVSATLEDITGLTFNITVPTGRTGTIIAYMTVQCEAGGANIVGAWAISINSVDGPETERNMSTSNTTGSVACQHRQTGLSAGTYAITGRHRRVSGASTADTDSAQLSAMLLLE
jgi:hypothetical protein